VSGAVVAGTRAVVDVLDLRARLDDGLAQLGGPSAALGEDARARLVRFVVLLAKWNRVHNLTAVRDAREMIGRHVLDSLALLPMIDAARFAGSPDRASDPASPLLVPDLLDIGSGGGLPVLPLAVARPDLACLSVDAVEKKIRFQCQAVLELGLTNVEARHARIETVDEAARIVVSRAFAAPADFLRVAAPRCAAGGTALVMLGQRERLPARLPDPFTLERLEPLDVPFGSGPRHVAVCRVPDDHGA